MSHSLHRFGSAESLKNDFCIYTRAAKGVNRDNCGDKLRKILSIYISENPDNFGSSHAGKSFVAGLKPDEYAQTLDNSYGIIANFDDAEKVKGVLKKAKEADVGISIVVSGLIDDVVQIAHDCGLKPHTASLSLGVFGKTEKLPGEVTTPALNEEGAPENEVLEMVTMCGHSLIASNLVKDVIEKVRKGKLSPEDAAIVIAKPCTCGIFNVTRCARRLKEILARDGSAQGDKVKKETK
ncbi:MAG: hypothetical protein LBJ36_00950 [Synergistaceae bacterium]|jgi:hypothetical protein|nr:hypothetical protein [Synergistaceae bacterium]